MSLILQEREMRYLAGWMADKLAPGALEKRFGR
jgi:hypothetical protein